MRKYELDVEQSKEVYEVCRRHIQPKHCYNNIFESVTDYMSKFRDGTWKVAYGYTEVMAGLYCRHCFILDNDKVIDPTVFTHSEPPTERTYFLMYAFDDVDEYFDAIEKNDYMPALDKHLRESDKEAVQWAKDNGYVFVG